MQVTTYLLSIIILLSAASSLLIILVILFSIRSAIGKNIHPKNGNALLILNLIMKGFKSLDKLFAYTIWN